MVKRTMKETEKYVRNRMSKAKDEGIQYPAPGEVRGEVQRLLKAVQKKKTQFKEAVFNSIELNLQSIDGNIQKVKDPKIIASSMQIFIKELREREKHVHNCMSKAKYCCCGSQFLEEELREFDECLKSFNRILVDTLEEEARNSIKKTQSGTVSSRKVQAAAIQEQNKELKSSNAMPKSSEKNSSAINNPANSDYWVQGISPERKGLTEKDQSSPPTHVREVKPQHVAHSSISLNTPREPNKESTSASVAPLKPSGDRGSSETDLEKDSAKMPKLKIEPIQLQAKPAPVMNLNLESFQPEIKPVQLQMKPAPAPNSNKESIQLKNYPRFEAEPVQQQIKPAPVKNMKTDRPEVETEPIQLQNNPEYQGRRFQ